MLKIIITGEKGYIGTSLQTLLEAQPDEYSVRRLSLRGSKPLCADFSDTDVIVHAAGIAHRKQTDASIPLYYEINRDLTYALAKKAKANGVRRFIFISSMSVYGMDTGEIHADTLPCPRTAYGKSKLMAEELITQLDDDAFSVAIIRPPMVYGKDCTGNFATLKKWALKLPVFPDICNRRSMIHIDNLCECLRLLAESDERGIFFPQDAQYTSTSEMLRAVALCGGKSIRPTKLFNPAIRLFSGKSGTLAKIFGNLTYDTEMSRKPDGYIVTDNETAIRKSVL